MMVFGNKRYLLNKTTLFINRLIGAIIRLRQFFSFSVASWERITPEHTDFLDRWRWLKMSPAVIPTH